MAAQGMRTRGLEWPQSLQKLQSRTLQSRGQHIRKKDDLHEFKIDYSEALMQVRLRSWIEEVLKQLRVQIDCNFLRDTRLIVALTVQRRIFMESYTLKFLRAHRRRNNKGNRGLLCVPQSYPAGK
jgi:hypothetical protein